MECESSLVSIGLPVYNGENFVAEAIQCVLAQTYSKWELVISDNASNDRTVSICREFAQKDHRIRLYESERNLGVAPNFNRCFELSRGRYFKWMAHDDIFSPNFIALCLEELQNDDHTVLVFSKMIYVDADGRPLRAQTSNLSILGSTPYSRFCQLTELATESTDIFWSQYGLIRRSVLQQTHLMDMYNGSDQVLLLEIALQGNFKQVDQELFFRREHPAASTMKSGWTANELARFVNTDDTRKRVLMNCRLLKEHLVCLRQASIPIWGKIRCAAGIFKRFWPRWRDFVLELVPPLQGLKAKLRVITGTADHR
jgi:glycosyltransferase involved in cell wall biosynthesis